MVMHHIIYIHACVFTLLRVEVLDNMQAHEKLRKDSCSYQARALVYNTVHSITTPSYATNLLGPDM